VSESSSSNQTCWRTCSLSNISLTSHSLPRLRRVFGYIMTRFKFLSTHNTLALPRFQACGMLKRGINSLILQMISVAVTLLFFSSYSRLSLKSWTKARQTLWTVWPRSLYNWRFIKLTLLGAYLRLPPREMTSSARCYWDRCVINQSLLTDDCFTLACRVQIVR